MRKSLAITLLLANAWGCHFRDRDAIDAGPGPDREERDAEAEPSPLLEPTRGTHLTLVTAYGSFSGAWEIELTDASGATGVVVPSGDGSLTSQARFYLPLALAGDVTVRSRNDGGAWRDHGVFTLESVALGPVPSTDVAAALAIGVDRTAIVGTQHGLPFIAELAPGEVTRWPEVAAPLADAGVPLDSGTADAAVVSDAAVDAGITIADGGTATGDGGVVADAGSPGAIPVTLESAAVYIGPDGTLGAIAALHPDGGLRRFVAQSDGTLAITDPELSAECVFGAGVDASGVYVWVKTATTVQRRRPDDGWATDVGPIALPWSRAGCPALAGDGSMIVAWSTIGGGPFDDTATVWTAQLEPGAVAFTPPAERGGPHDDSISFTHLQGTAEGHHILSYCYTDSGIGGDGTECRGPRLLRVPAGGEELAVGPTIDGKVRAHVSEAGVLWSRNLTATGHSSLRIPDTLEERIFEGAVAGPVAISDAATFHAPITTFNETWILVLPARSTP